MTLTTFLILFAILIAVGIYGIIYIPESFEPLEKGKTYAVKVFNKFHKFIFDDDHEHLNDPHEDYYDPLFPDYAYLPDQWGDPGTRDGKFHWKEESITKKLIKTTLKQRMRHRAKIYLPKFLIIYEKIINSMKEMYSNWRNDSKKSMEDFKDFFDSFSISFEGWKPKIKRTPKTDRSDSTASRANQNAQAISFIDITPPLTPKITVYYTAKPMLGFFWIGLAPFFRLHEYDIKKVYFGSNDYQPDSSKGEELILRTERVTIYSRKSRTNHIRPQSELRYVLLDAETGDPMKTGKDGQKIQGLPLNIWGLTTMRAYDPYLMLTRNEDYVSVFLEAVKSAGRDAVGQLTYEGIISSENESGASGSFSVKMQEINRDTDDGNPSLIKLNGVGFQKINVDQVELSGDEAKEWVRASVQVYLAEQKRLAQEEEAKGIKSIGEAQNQLLKDKLQKEGEGKALALLAETKAQTKNIEQVGKALKKARKDLPPNPDLKAKWDGVHGLQTYIEDNSGTKEKTTPTILINP